jgi:hypothetical protein
VGSRMIWCSVPSGPIIWSLLVPLSTCEWKSDSPPSTKPLEWELSQDTEWYWEDMHDPRWGSIEPNWTYDSPATCDLVTSTSKDMMLRLDGPHGSVGVRKTCLTDLPLASADIPNVHISN